VVNRMKEVGVRKVLGGSAAGIAQLVNRKLLYLMTAAAIIAAPLAYYGMDMLLDNVYAYRMELNAVPFIFTYLLIIATTALTISSQIQGINRAKPADIMRIE
jgi:putative ABC transport system permease protein